jgi:hypothetical protein
MTVEHRLLFGLADILAVTFECTNCGVRLSVAPQKVQPDRMRQCQSCGALWLANDITVGGPFQGGPYMLMLAALRYLADPPKSNLEPVMFKLHLEFAAPVK